MSFSHSRSGSHHEGSYEEVDIEVRFSSQKRIYEERIHKYEEKIKMHLHEIDEVTEECVRWKKKHLDVDEHN